jgi:hypothetical protein
VVWLPLILLAVASPFVQLMQGQDADLSRSFERVGLIPVWPASFRPISEEAGKSGFHKGDLVVAVDGVPLAGGPTAAPTEELARKLLGPDGTTVRIAARSADGVLREHRLTRSVALVDRYFRASGISRSMFDWITFLTNLVANTTVVVAAILLFAKGGRHPAAVLLSFGLPLVGMVYSGGANLLALLDLVFLFDAFQTFAWTVLILAVMLFPDGKFSSSRMRWIAILLVILTPVGMIGMATGSLSVIVVAPAHTAFLAAAAASLIARYRSQPAGQERQQFRWAMFGFSVGLVCLVIYMTLLFVVLPKVEAPLPFVWGTVLNRLVNGSIMVAIAGGLMISLLRYRLYDADAIISRSVAIGVMTLILLGVFAGTEKVIELLGEEWFGEELGVLAGGLGAAVAAVMIVPLHHRLTHWAERRFQKQLIRLRTGLPELVGDMRETAPVARIAAATLDWVTRGVRASRVALAMDGEVIDARGIDAEDVEAWKSGWIPVAQDGFDTHRDDAVFPLRLPLQADGHGRMGWLLLGPRPDGSFYGRDERETLAQIAGPVARALKIAAAREKREDEEREAWQEQRALNRALLGTLQTIDRRLERLFPPPAAAAE